MGHAFHACAALGTLTCALHHLVLRDIMEGVRVGEGETGGTCYSLVRVET